MPTRERMVAAAWELLGEGGPDAVTLREVGRRTGLSRTAPYRHFQDKDDLLRAVAVRAFERLHDRMRDAVDAADDPAQALRGACRAYVGFALDQPRHYRMMFGDWVLAQKHAEGPQSGSLREAADRLFGLAATVIQSGQRAGALRTGDPSDFSLLTWSFLHGLVTFTLSAHLNADSGAGEPGGEFREALDRLIDEVVHGLAA
ncbi:TetR/AcrR family transcriptional regulator [Murinocardiopsis flavida]|uniref:TetR/AcrR family transcriptional regulator n=1 Tax=Murinocardiopsis flavida TaxID=645275 RepID=UPI001FEABC5D|nr:TetR/AcrR family transcriptional regulator [Murinocardiopsis flavida]